MFKLTAVKALPGYRLWVHYADGVEGEVSLAHLVGKGVFRAWETPGAFEQVRIGEYGQLLWDDAVELCADALYLQLTHLSPEQVFSSLQYEPLHA